MTFLSSLGTNPASLVALHMGPMWLLKVYGIALNTVKNIQELLEITCYHDMQFIAETNCSFRCLASPYILSGHSQCLLLFSRSVTSDSLQLDRLQNTLSLSFTISWSLLKLMSIELVMPSNHQLMSIELVMPSNHLFLCRPLLLLPSIFPSIRVFSNESVLHIGWSKYWCFSPSINPSNEYSGLISFRMDWLDLLAVQGTLKSVLQHHSSKASILRHSAFFMVQLSHPYMTTGKTIALTRWTFVSKVVCLLFNMLCF